MRIYSMQATFGKLEHQTLTLQPGLNVIHAPNEWGKSTWCAFLVAMLYGIETRVHSTKTVLADKERYAPWSGSPMSGRMDLNWNGRDITIERRSKGRSIFGVFRAYETQSGLEIPELTADNCGQTLLGVEKSVFLRAGFLKQTDLPVTEDKALWRRLNALVTTGDESGAADALDQKIRDLKNRCRANRANGLIPQALAQKEQLEQSLRQISELQSQSLRIRQRQQALGQHIQQLHNHKDALDYAAAQDYAQRAAGARYQLESLRQQLQRQQEICEALPGADDIYPQLNRLQTLQQRRQALQLEVQMQPGAPEMLPIPAPFRDLTPQQALQQAREDSKLYELHKAVGKPRSLWTVILGLVLTGTGGVLLAMLTNRIPAIALLAAGLVLSLTGMLLQNRGQKRYQESQAVLQRLLALYAPLAPEFWLEEAQGYEAEHRRYEAALERHQKELGHVKEDMLAIELQLQELTGDQPTLQWEHRMRDALEQHRLLADLTRQVRQAESVTQALGSQHTMPQPPKMPDTMSYSMAETARLLSDAEAEHRQLHQQLGRCHGQMEALGQPEDLQAKLSAVQARLQKLDQTYAALELAQQTLAAASAELQRRFAPRISQRAQTLFGKLTGGRYDRLTLSGDLSLMAGAQDEDTLRGSLWRSDGTSDQLYLALRLAVAEELTPNAPLILDDALVRFDDTRLAAAMQILREEAADQQVILFTCQSREQAFLDGANM